MWYSSSHSPKRCWAVRRPFLLLLSVLACGYPLARPAQANTLFQNFTLTNSQFANGSVDFFDGGLTLVLTGPNDGSGNDGTTDFTATASTAGLFQFNYVYSTLDFDGYDFAGYTLNAVFYWLADSGGQSGAVNLPLIAGDRVGFRIASVDNLGEPGIMTITDFSSPALVGTPEAATFWLMLGAVSVLVCLRRLPAFGKRGVGAIAGVAALLTALPAQAQTEFAGTDITGSVTLTRVVNLTQLAQGNLTGLGAHPLAAGLAVPSDSALRAPFPRFPLRRLRPPVSGRPLAPSRHGVMYGSSERAMVSTPAAGVQGLTVTGANGVEGFNALSHADQRNADHGNQFSVEPPSPSIAASGSYILEGVNNAVQVYLASGVPVLPAVLSSNQVFGLAPAIVRGIGLVPDIYGVYLTDMRVYFDQTINRWFIVQRAQDNDVAGYPLNSSHLYIAVSQTSNPAGDYGIYVMDTTNAGHIGCPCIADYPQIGSDQYGFHIAWNEFNAYSYSFVDAAIMTLSKAGLAAGAAAPMAYRFLLPYATGYEFAIQPATTPPGAANFVASGGIAYFVSTLSRFAYDGGIALWAMRNTSSMATPSPGPVLSRIVVPVLSYASPDVANQRAGPLPYGWSLFPAGTLAYLDGGDSRVQSLTYSGGRLYLTFSTSVTDEVGRYGVGVEYVVLSPTYRGGVLAASVLNQGYLVVSGNHLLRPALAVNAQGRGAIAATLVGPDWYPTAATIPFDTFSTPLSAQVAAAGALPEDGFTGYPDGGGAGIARWGDYSTAVAGSDGAIWMVAEYIGTYLRTDYANWNTYVMRKQP